LPKRFFFIALRYSIFATLFAMPLVADQVIMKDGTVYKGKITIDTEKAVLISNPPYDPESYLLETKDIEKIIYEEYKPLPPAQRKRGLTSELQVGGYSISSDQIATPITPGLYGGLGFRIHPSLELGGGMEWLMNLSAKDPLSVTNGTVLRRYEDFWMYSGVVMGRIYPFFKKPWKTEPYLFGGYRFSRLIPKSSGDSLTGSGWLAGVGAIHPLGEHWFLDGRLLYGRSSFGKITYLGQEGSIRPEITQRTFQASLGLSFRL